MGLSVEHAVCATVGHLVAWREEIVGCVVARLVGQLLFPRPPGGELVPHTR